MATVAPAPSSPRAGRRTHFRGALLGRTAFWTLFVGIGGSVLLAAMWHDARVAVIGSLVTIAGVVIFAYRYADKKSELEFFVSLAPSLGMSYLGELGVVGITPLLAAGDRRHLEYAMSGGGAQLGMYTYEVERRNSNGNVERREPYHFTVCIMDLAANMPSYPGVYLCRKRGLLHGDDWLRRDRSHKVELESIAFNERYDLLRESDQDEMALRELFSPSLVDWLATHPLAPGFELRAGVLVVWLPGHVEDAGKLSFFLEAAHHLADAVQRQAQQAAATTV
ncbi:MAG TPA: hypothetical protein VH817_14525 [Thermoleophilaceae bacterium]|jgi:hypothetical protein